MTRREFIDKLKAALEQDLSPREVQEQVTFYNDYIRDEVRKGRTEEAVTAELGDPWAIARNIISAAEITGEGSFGQESGGRYQEPERRRSGAYREESGSQIHIFGAPSRWQILLVVLGVIGVIALVIAVIGGIFSLLAPILVPLLVILIIFQIFGKTPVKTGVFC